MTIPKSIILIDDEPDILIILEMKIKETFEDIALKTFTCGESFLLELQEDNFLDSVDCIISDYDMPKFNGIDLYNITSEINPSINFIMFTGRLEKDQDLPFEVVKKPDIDHLIRQITNP